VCSWVVTEEASRPELIDIDQERVHFFKVLSLDKLSQILPIFRTESLLTPTGLKRLFDSLGARVRGSVLQLGQRQVLFIPRYGDKRLEIPPAVVPYKAIIEAFSNVNGSRRGILYRQASIMCR